MTPALLGAVAGPALQLQQPVLWSAAVYLGVVAIALATCGLLAVRSIAGWWRAALLLSIAAALAFALCGLRAGHFAGQGLEASLEGRDIAVVGIVSAMPQRNELGQRFRLRLESVQLAGSAVRVPPAIYLGWYGGSTARLAETAPRSQVPDVRAGERWRMTVRLRAPHGNSNPHGFDYELWLWEQGLQATGYVRAGPNDLPPERLGMTWWHPVEQARQSVREAIFARVADRKNAGLLAALVVGDQNAIDRADWDIFRATGVAHLMSISGLHVTMFAWAAGLLVGALWRRSQRLCLAWPAQHAALVGGALLAAGYALFSGWGVPAQRTVWMLATIALLRLSGRRWPWPVVWLLTCAVVVSVDPWALMQAGFWLSFVAVGVLFASDAGGAEARPLQLKDRLLSLLREQGVVTLALTPLSLLLFGQVSVVGLLANLLAIPWITLLVTPLALGGVLVPLLWDAAAAALQALGFFLQALAAVPFASVSTAAPPLWAGAAGVFGGLLLAMRLPWSGRLLGLPLLLPVLLWQAPRPAMGQFELIAADIGQGNAVIVRTASHTLVYDSGPRFGSESDAGQRVLVPLLRALGDRVDTVLISHRDSDHSGGAVALLTAQPQAMLLSSIEDGHELQTLRKATRCSAGQRWQWDEVSFELLHPEVGDYDTKNKTNALSCVLRISNGRHSALLAGDIEQPQEARLVAAVGTGTGAGLVLKSDLLLVPHHGSKTSSSEAFLDAVQPTWALVQAGYRNRYGHPADVVAQRYHARGIRLIDSPRCGAARWSSSDAGRIDCHRDQVQRYWQHRIP